MFPTTLVIGIPGSGKTSIARAMAEHRGGTHFSASAVLALHAANNISVGRRWRGLWASGQMAPDPEVLPVLWKTYADLVSKAPVFLDGYPRTVAQLEDFHTKGGEIKLAVLLKVDESTARQRIAARLRREARSDDEIATSHWRIEHARDVIKEITSDDLIRNSLAIIDCNDLPIGSVIRTVMKIYDNTHIRQTKGDA
jgi:adenylate kinase